MSIPAVCAKFTIHRLFLFLFSFYLVLPPVTYILMQVMGSWKHYNLSSQTLNERNQRATSPLVSRELTRYTDTAVYCTDTTYDD